MWYVYILKSIGSDFTYIGFTNDVRRRLSKHNNGETPSTKHYIPLELEAYVAVKTKNKARALERYFKTGSGKAVLNKRILEADLRY